MPYGVQGPRRSPYRPPYRRPYGGGIVYESPYAYPAYYPVYPYDIADDGYFSDDSTGSTPYYASPDPEDAQSYGYGPGAEGTIGRRVPYLPNDGGPGSGPDSGPDSSSNPAPARVSPQDNSGTQPVTLVFKDGRPNQQIRNFLINGNTLTVWDQHPHDIPVDQLNVPATEKINHDAGVDLFLPSRTR